MAKITEPCDAYKAALERWTTLRDVNEGARAVKAKGSVYLPRPSGLSERDHAAAYLKRAQFAPFFNRTVLGLLGVMLGQPPVATGVPELLLPQLGDLDLAGRSLTDVARAVVTELLVVGRVALLVDMPAAGSLTARPYIVTIPAERVIDWKVARVGDDPSALVRVVIRETVDDGEEQYRELALAHDVNGQRVYQVRLWTRSDPKLVTDVQKMPFAPGPWLTPVRRGAPLTFIPFVFASPLGTQADIVKPPLEDLATVLLGHYANSADYEFGLHMCALPTPWCSGFAGGGGNDSAPITVGPSVVWMLSENGKAGMIEFSGHGLAAIRAAMEAKEKQAAIVGARLLLEPPNAREAETATSARLRFAAETASLHTIAGSASAALTTVVRTLVWWQSAEPALPLDVKVRVGGELFQVRATADEIKAAIFAWQAGAISYETFYARLQGGGWAREGVTAEQEREAIANATTELEAENVAKGLNPDGSPIPEPALEN